MPDSEWSIPSLWGGVADNHDGVAADATSDADHGPCPTSTDHAATGDLEATGNTHTRWNDVLESDATYSRPVQPPLKVHVRAKLVGDAAKAKARREKVRRAELNQKCDLLMWCPFFCRLA